MIQPIVVKALLLLNILKSSPLLMFSGLGSPVFTGMRGTPTIDANIAYTSHALGTFAARTLAAGGSLWWNPLEGVGTPLAGEMQSAALFPPTWLMLLPNGQLIEHLLFQIVSGMATFLLARRLGLGVLASWFAGTAFSFNGTFAWLANAVVNPICFMPIILLGVELLLDGPTRDRLVGGVCVALGVAGSLYAGFPEVAYLDALLIAGWTIVRASGLWPDRRGVAAILARTGGFALAGAMLAAPLLIAFVDFLEVANVGEHGGGGFANAMRPLYAAMFLIPYLTGAIGHAPVAFWNNIGGYGGIALVSLAVAGIAGRSRLRIYLLLWSLLALAAMYRVEPLASIISSFPGLRAAAVYRYVEPSLALALALLAAMALDDFARGIIRLSRLRWAVASTLGTALVLAAVALAHGLAPLQRVEAAPTVLHCLLIMLFAASVLVRRWSPHTRAVVIAVCGACEIVALFAVPMISYPLKRKAEVGGVIFLQRHLGLQRFVSAGPISLPGSIAANYGSYFGIAQVNWNDLPVPQAWVNYVHRRIDRTASPIYLLATPANVLAAEAAYAEIGVGYVTVPATASPLPLAQVYGDSQMRIYALSGTRPYFTAAGCVIVPRDRMVVESRCPVASRLERLELLMQGWSATVNDHPAPISPTREIFQSVELPAGTATVRFAFEPPYLWLGKLAAAAGLVLLASLLVLERRGGRSRLGGVQGAVPPLKVRSSAA